MRQALKDGHIVMHAFPFDAEPEVLDREMFSWALNFTSEIARANSAVVRIYILLRLDPTHASLRITCVSAVSHEHTLQRF